MTTDVEKGRTGAGAGDDGSGEADHAASPSPRQMNQESRQRASDVFANHQLPFLVNNWFILSLLWLYDFLVQHLVHCCGLHRDLSFSVAQDCASWFNPATDKKQQHCYFNQTSSDLSLATIDNANSSTSCLFMSEGCVRSMECFCHEINSFKTSQQYLLDQIRSDRVISTLPAEDRRRRTIIVERKGNSFGFVLQTYGIRHKKDDSVELLTYVDRVDVNGPAFKAGLREGDVILSINGQDMEKADHRSLVKYIQNCEKSMRMVVLFENCVHKVELHTRFIKLRRELSLRKQEYERLCYREKQILSKIKSNTAATSATMSMKEHNMTALSDHVTAGPDALPFDSSCNWRIPRCNIHPARDQVISHIPQEQNGQSKSLPNHTTGDAVVHSHIKHPNEVTAAAPVNCNSQDVITKL